MVSRSTFCCPKAGAEKLKIKAKTNRRRDPYVSMRELQSCGAYEVRDYTRPGLVRYKLHGSSLGAGAIAIIVAECTPPSPIRACRPRGSISRCAPAVTWPCCLRIPGPASSAATNQSSLTLVHPGAKTQSPGALEGTAGALAVKKNPARARSIRVWQRPTVDSDFEEDSMTPKTMTGIDGQHQDRSSRTERQARAGGR